MPHDSKIAESGPTPDSDQQARTDVSVPKRQSATTTMFYLAAALFELVCVALMTWLRYSNQGLDVQFLDFTKSANVYGLLAGLPFIGAYGTAAFTRRLQTASRAVTALSFGSVSLGLIILLFVLPEPDRPLIGVIYFIFKAIVLGILVVAYQKKPRRWWKSVLASLAVTLAVSAVCITYVVSSVLINPITPAPTTAAPQAQYDAGVILGAAVWSGNKPSPVFRERIRTGYELLKNGTIEFIVLTGGSAPNELTEAEVAKRSLLERGVDPTRIVLEEQTSSTVEQIIFVRDELTKQGWDSFVIISDQFHLKRALEICAFNEITAHGFPSESPLGPRNLAIYHLRESVALTLYWMYGL